MTGLIMAQVAVGGSGLASPAGAMLAPFLEHAGPLGTQLPAAVALRNRDTNLTEAERADLGRAAALVRANAPA